MKNEFGVKLDRNGYAPSIVSERLESCWVCELEGDLARHEIFEGNGRRAKSKRLGLWVMLCPFCHEMVHLGGAATMVMKGFGERIAREHYGWSKEKFIQEFGRSYLEE